MSKGKASRAPATIFIAVIGAILAVLLLALAIALFLRSGRQLGLPASVGLPDPVPVQLQPVPTAPPPREVATVPPPQPAEPQAPPQPTAVPPAQPPPVSPPVFPSEVEPVPVEGGADDGSGAPVSAQGDTAGSVEPYPVGPGSTGSSASTGSARGGGGARVACGVRVVHVVRPGENLFRIALRYNTTITAIARRNGISDPRSIRSGQRLSIVTCR